MLEYNPKDWLTFIFKFHKSDTIRQLLPMLLLIAIYSASVAYLEISYWKLCILPLIKNKSTLDSIPTFM